jgi:hypothetical protein
VPQILSLAQSFFESFTQNIRDWLVAVSQVGTGQEKYRLCQTKDGRIGSNCSFAESSTFKSESYRFSSNDYKTELSCHGRLERKSILTAKSYECLV